MLIVVPVSTSDAHLIPAFTAALRRCGGIKQHTCLVVATPSAAAEAQKVAECLEELSSGCKQITLEADPHGGWPLACNIHYHDTVDYLARTKNEQFWYWMELDNTPLKQGWADALSDEYHRERKPYLGPLVPTWKIDNPGTPNERKRQEADHMLGTAIYPANHHMRGIFWKHASTGMPFDVAQQYEVGGQNNQNVHNTKLIQHQWGVVNFRRENGVIICDDRDRKYDISYAGPLSDEAVVHHGCKDGSLSALLCGPVFEKFVAQKASERASAILLDALEKAPVVQISTPADLAKMQADKELAEMVYGNSETKSTAVTTTVTLPVTTDDLAARIKNRLKAGSLRCSELAKDEGRSNEDMKTWLEANGFTVAVPGWVKVK